MAMWRSKLVLFIVFHFSYAQYSERDRTRYQDSDCLQGTALGVSSRGGNRIPNSNFWASSSSSDVRQPYKARLEDSTGAWTASILDTNQYLGIDLGGEYILTDIWTQGRQGSGEFVTEFYIAFSSDKTTWREYTNEYGIRQMFGGNTNSDMIAKNYLKYPVVARYIMFHPQRWVGVISMRLEIFGCKYTSEVATFDGKSSISYDLSVGNTGPMPSNNIKLRFKTKEQNGVLFYASGNQRDYLSLELVQGRLVMHIDLGSTANNPGATNQTGGNLLDDSQWHDVIIWRNRTDVRLVVDRLETYFKTNGLFYRLNLDRTIYLGGVPTFNVEGITVRHNFTGCLENVVFEGSKMISDAKNRIPGYTVGNSQIATMFSCKIDAPSPATFPSIGSYVKYTSSEIGLAVRINFDFRTHDPDGILLFHKLDSTKGGGFIQVQFLKGITGFVQYKLQTSDQESTADTIEDVVRNTAGDLTSGFADGLWHKFTLLLNNEKLNVTIDRNSKVSIRTMSIGAGTIFYLGGYIFGNGFRGCMRSVSISSQPVDFAAISEINRPSVLTGSCGLIDRCTPNPCEHYGVCTQTWDSFVCDCSNTGYKGEVCHVSAYYLSCEMFKMYSNDDGLVNTHIDPDGSGPLPPFPVGCDGKKERGKIVKTVVYHDAMEQTTVDGFQSPNFYKKVIQYSGDIESLTNIIERSASCYQNLEYRCNNSRLLGEAATNADYFAWWVGRTNQPMYYWGGAAPGSNKCFCGLQEKGCTGQKTTCNCDAQTMNEFDGGNIVHKDYLPIMELYFGDTGTLMDDKIGKYKVGELSCEGDSVLDSIVTFRKADATIKIDTWEADPAGDIWFQFKTTTTDGTILHNIGDPDYIKVALFNGDTIQFSYDTGNGAKVVDFKTTNALNDDQWHTVHVEKNRKQAWLRVDNFPEKYITESSDEMSRTLDLKEGLVIGATVEFKAGYVGCLRGLRVNGVLVDLRGLIQRGQVSYGVTEGCIGKCSSNPCFNGGTCIEGYSGYTCDCSYTPWRGWMCGREVGVNLQKHFMIRYEFDKNQGLSTTDFKDVKVGFTTKTKQGILMQIQSPNGEYISLELNNAGGVKFVVNVGEAQRFEMNTKNDGIDYTNNQQHVAHLWRTGANSEFLNLQVDNYQIAFDKLGDIGDQILDDPKYLFIGNNGTSNAERGFEGCIYRMSIDNIFPLKRAFQDPRPSYMWLYPNNTIREDMCGFEEVTVIPDPIEIRPGSGGTLVNITYPYVEDTSARDKAITGGVLAVVFLIIIVCIIIAVMYFREKGDYSTKEATGQDFVDNPDAALVINSTGVPDIGKRQEWFM
ncbi:neurexin-4-like isoform X2 [Mytilus californianus]|uniref:neurexin-4-like isoform X2 n=1 Tax=Mytilus californianus TaxID=6549 RepID=UPI0022455220|nr:neurexin-4-like isoform X2 [Mytilus californianus]